MAKQSSTTTKRKPADAKSAANKPSSKATKAKLPKAPKAAVAAEQKPFENYPTHDTPVPPLPSSRTLLRTSLGIVRRHWKLFLGILAIYALLNVLFVQTILGMNVSSVKSSLDQLFQGKGSKVTSATALFTYMLGSAGSPSSDGGAYQLLFLLMLSLAIIYTFRELYEGRTPRIRDAFYNGMFPLVPFVLMLVTIAAELLPLTLGATLYSAVMTNGIAVHNVEIVFWTLFFLGTAVLSLYLIVPTIISLYASTQAGMVPMRALRRGRRLTYKRRLRVLGRLLFLPLILFVGAGVILVPIIMAVPALASAISFALLLVGIAIAHGYLLELYRGLGE